MFEICVDYIRLHRKSTAFSVILNQHFLQTDHLAEQFTVLLFSMAVYRTIGGNVSVRLNYGEC